MMAEVNFKLQMAYELDVLAFEEYMDMMEELEEIEAILEMLDEYEPEYYDC